MPEAWRDEPVTKGELHDALIEAADRVEAATKTVEANYQGMAKQLMRYASRIQGDLFRWTARALKGDG